jgi:hypothetical protein
MTEEELRKAYFEWRRTASQNFHPSATMKNATPKPSLEARLDWLEADAAAQRTAILKLESDNRWHKVGLWVLWTYFVGLLLLLAINFPLLEMLP